MLGKMLRCYSADFTIFLMILDTLIIWLNKPYSVTPDPRILFKTFWMVLHVKGASD